jgi:hypothetical protein
MGAARARAHTLPISSLTLMPDEDYLHLELTLNPFELTFFSEVDANGDGRLDPGEWEGQGESIALRILERLTLGVNGRVVNAEIAGLSQNYDSHHIAVRAHYAVDARQARVTVQSQLAALTSGSHVTQVTFGRGEQVQAARLEMQSPQATFEALVPPAAHGSSKGTDETQSIAAFKVNETAVAVLLGLLLVAGIPPLFFGVLLSHRRLARGQLAPP